MANLTNKPEFIIVHISDSSWGCRRDIDKWHKERGWAGCGYHVVIMNGKVSTSLELPCLNGSIELGRPFDEVGAHTIGYNNRSIGICGIGKGQWTHSQFSSLVVLIRALQKQFGIPTKNVLGHCETESGKAEGKTCPDLDMDLVRRAIENPLVVFPEA